MWRLKAHARLMLPEARTIKRFLAPLLVFIFGLIHGLGFAQKLLDERIPSGSIVSSLLGFNIGVEFGQLAVIGLAVAATFWIKDEEKYRGWVVIPASAAIALAGLFWAYQRVA